MTDLQDRKLMVYYTQQVVIISETGRNKRGD